MVSGQAQQTGKPIVPPHQMATGIECADTLAEAIERRTHLACHGALLGFGCRQLPARPCQESGAQQQQPDRQAGTTQCEKASVGVGAVAFAAPFIEQAFLLGAHVGQGRIDLSHKAPSEIRLLDRQRGAEPVPTAERDRLRQILELALKQRRQCTQTILLVGVVGGQRNQLALQLDGAPDGIVVRGEVVLPAGQQVAALAGFGGAHRDPEFIDGRYHFVGVANQKLRLTSVGELHPGQQSNHAHQQYGGGHHQNVGVALQTTRQGVPQCDGNRQGHALQGTFEILRSGRRPHAAMTMVFMDQVAGMQ